MDFEQIKIAVADIRPGDTLFLHYEHFLSKEQRIAMEGMMMTKFPEAEKVVILEGGLRLSVARAGSDQLLEEIRDAVKQMAQQFDAVSASGNTLCVTPTII